MCDKVLIKVEYLCRLAFLPAIIGSPAKMNNDVPAMVDSVAAAAAEEVPVVEAPASAGAATVPISAVACTLYAIAAKMLLLQMLL